MTHVGKNGNLFPRFLPLFTWHLSKWGTQNVTERGSKMELTFTVTYEACVILCMGAYSRYANLLDDILAPILFGFDKDGLSKWTFPDFLHLFVLVHVSGMTGSSCWVCKEIKAHITKLCSSWLGFGYKAKGLMTVVLYIAITWCTIINFSYSNCASFCKYVSSMEECCQTENDLRRAVMLRQHTIQLVARQLTFLLQ